ncbi:MAG: ABC transporter permease, partial [Ignavibacteriaceae bacterium]|nr:ABC transporter permease [Ignavibacteriaceae bacterium]
FILIMLLMMMILYSGGMLIRSLIEEKSNRLIEVLVSSCTADELLTGKILGLSALGLFQILIWAILAVVLAGSSIIPADAFKNVLPMLIYFILGFIFYTSIFVGAGAIATTEQEAQQLTSYISLVLLFPIILVFSAVQNSNSFLLQVLSYIPFTTPSILILRLNLQDITLHEILITVLIMLVSIYIAINAAAKIFRIGILSYGKRPSLKEIIRWIREK